MDWKDDFSVQIPQHLGIDQALLQQAKVEVKIKPKRKKIRLSFVDCIGTKKS